MEAIGINSQKFKVLFLNRLVFLDSAAFLGASLDSLVKTLRESNHPFNIMKQWAPLRHRTPWYAVKENFAGSKIFGNLGNKGRTEQSQSRQAMRAERAARGHGQRHPKDFEVRWIFGTSSRTTKVGIIDKADPLPEPKKGKGLPINQREWNPTPVEQAWADEKMQLLMRKGVFAYDFVKGGAKQLFFQRGLPSQEEFFNVLLQENCSEEDYLHARKVWGVFHCQTFLDFSMLYNMSDVFLLAEAVEDMRARVFTHFGLDMNLFFSFPHLSKQLMLRYTKAEPEMISDYAMADLLRSGIRGGMAYVNQRLIKLHTKTDQDGNLETYLDEACTIPACLIYLDENNL